MDLSHSFLNFTVIPLTFLVLFFILPPYLVFKFLRFVLNSTLHAENLAMKVILITGASSGIGEHIAYEYARQGARLAIAARREERLREVAKRASLLGSPDVLVIVADVSSVDDCKRMVDETIHHFGRVDHLVNNAGVSSVSLFEEYTNIYDFKAIMDINFWGSVYITKFTIPHLKRSCGKIIVVASLAHYNPHPRTSLYNATKAAMVNFFETLRVELGSKIKIVIAAPFYTESEMTEGKSLVRKDEMKYNLQLKNYIKRNLPGVMKGEDCAKTIVDSARRGDRYVTVPLWSKFLGYINLICPELLEFIFRYFSARYSESKP